MQFDLFFRRPSAAERRPNVFLTSQRFCWALASRSPSPSTPQPRGDLRYLLSEFDEFFLHRLGRVSGSSEVSGLVRLGARAALRGLQRLLGLGGFSHLLLQTLDFRFPISHGLMCRGVIRRVSGGREEKRREAGEFTVRKPSTLS